MKHVVSIGSLFLLMLLIALATALAAILIQYTGNLPHGYLRTFLMTLEISFAIVVIGTGIYYFIIEEA